MQPIAQARNSPASASTAGRSCTACEAAAGAKLPMDLSPAPVSAFVPRIHPPNCSRGLLLDAWPRVETVLPWPESTAAVVAVPIHSDNVSRSLRHDWRIFHSPSFVIASPGWRKRPPSRSDRIITVSNFTAIRSMNSACGMGQASCGPSRRSDCRSLTHRPRENDRPARWRDSKTQEYRID